MAAQVVTGAMRAIVVGTSVGGMGGWEKGVHAVQMEVQSRVRLAARATWVSQSASALLSLDTCLKYTGTPNSARISLTTYIDS